MSAARPAPVVAATGVSLGLVGPGAIGGVTTCTIAAAANTCTASGATIDTAQIGALISANRTSGDALTGGLSSPFNVLATPPGAPTGITAIQVQGGIQVSFTPPVNTGGAPIISYTVTCNPGADHCGRDREPDPRHRARQQHAVHVQRQGDQQRRLRRRELPVGIGFLFPRATLVRFGRRQRQRQLRRLGAVPHARDARSSTRSRAAK